MHNRIIAFLIILILFPFFFILSIIILFEDNFPIFFKQKRVGYANKEFYIYKFRTMKRDTPEVATSLLTNAPTYLLKTGKILRKLSIDELPNLYNIFKGEMVFVGPRPALFNQYDLIKLRKIAGVDKLIPGITGWAQINGRDEITIEKKVQLDKEYLYRKSFLFDLKIIVKTFTNVLLSKGVKH